MLSPTLNTLMDVDSSYKMIMQKINITVNLKKQKGKWGEGGT